MTQGADLGAAAALVRAGMGRAEQGLTALLDEPVRIDVEPLTMEPVLGVGRLISTPEAAVTGIYVGFSGDLSGHCLLCLDTDTAGHLAARMLGGDNAADAADMVDSALLEAGNVTVSGLINGVADTGSFTIHVSPPVLARDMLGSLLDSILAAATLTSEDLLAVRARFRCQGEAISGTILMMPDAASLQALLGARGVAL